MGWETKEGDEKRMEGAEECRLYAPVVGAVDGSRAWRMGETARSSTTGAGVGRAGGVTIATASMAALVAVVWWLYRGGGGRCQVTCEGGGPEASTVYVLNKLDTNEKEIHSLVNHKTREQREATNMQQQVPGGVSS